MTNEKKLTVGQIIFTIFYLFLWPALFLFLSGDWFWIEGWIFGIWFLITTFTIITYMYVKDPALLAERYRKQGTGNQKKWDKYFFMAMAIVFIAWIILIPFESKRFEWTSDFPVILQYLGGVCLLISTFFLYRSFTDNTFLSPLIRIQTERKQQLVTTGVYSIIRHPMYLGGILMFVGAPLLLGSYFGISLGIIMTFFLAIRTVGEEKMMQVELDGYDDYKKKVKFRFIPFIW
jgi:protein-S-isoprenylcysteine O-methyltransferase Ste14